MDGTHIDLDDPTSGGQSGQGSGGGVPVPLGSARPTTRETKPRKAEAKAGSGGKKSLTAPASGGESGSGDNTGVVVPMGLLKPSGIKGTHYADHSLDCPSVPVKPPGAELHVRHVQHLGWRHDLPDPRDHRYAAPLGLELPSRGDLRKSMPPVYDQGQLGSCTGNAIAAAVQFERMRHNLSDAQRVPSRLFIYYNERVIEDCVDHDAGAQLRDGIKSVASQGVCFESGRDKWPYVISKFKTKPPAKSYENASKDRVVSYSRVQRMLGEMRGCLATGFPFVFGLTVFQSFDDASAKGDGDVPMPAIHEKLLGGHAMLAVGYDDAKQRFLVRNSWGVDCGKGGYMTLPYAYLMSPDLSDDFWTIRLVSLPQQLAAGS